MFLANRRSTPALPESIERGLWLVRERFPVVDEILAAYGSSPADEYLDSLLQVAPASAQHAGDFITCFSAQTERLLGAEVAGRVAQQLRQQSLVLTTNHHGLDTFAQSLQTNLLFSLRTARPSVIPVLACGNVPMNNLTYPRGLLVYAVREDAGCGGALKIPLFPDRVKRRMVCRVAPFDNERLEQLRKRFGSPALTESVSTGMLRELHSVVEDAFVPALDDNFSCYTDQATLVNALLWRRLFSEHSPAPDLVYVELEHVAAELLIKDLDDPASLATMILLDERVRQTLLSKLDGVQGCWQFGGLHKPTLTSCFADGTREIDSGTAFFWGIDARGRRVSLNLERNSDGTWYLTGVDGKGAIWAVPVTAGELRQALTEGRILPSLFTSYAVIALARGVTCVGGYYQAAYLPKMQAGVAMALRVSASSRAREIADCVSLAVTNKYLSGMQAVVANYQRRRVPAGIAEIAVTGGLTGEQLRAMRGVLVRDAHIASLSDTLMDGFGSEDGVSALINAVNAALPDIELPGVQILALDD